MEGDQYACRNRKLHCDRRKALLEFTQPLTAAQLAQKMGLSMAQCTVTHRTLRSQQHVKCLNPASAYLRIYWLTQLGKRYQRQIARGVRLLHDVPKINWDLYGSVCYSHRSEVIKNLTFPMQPATLRRRATFRKSSLRMSANNVRDVIRYLKPNGIVRPVPLKKKAHPGYELTDVGLHMRRLLLQAEVRG